MSGDNSSNQSLTKENGGATGSLTLWVPATVSSSMVSQRKKLEKNEQRLNNNPPTKNWEQQLVPTPAPIDTQKIRQMLSKDYGVSEKGLLEGFEAASNLATVVMPRAHKQNQLITNFMSWYKDSFFPDPKLKFASKVVTALTNPIKDGTLTSEMQLVTQLFILQSASLPNATLQENQEQKQDYTALVLNSLRKIDQILEKSSELILKAVQKATGWKNIESEQEEKSLQEQILITLQCVANNPAPGLIDKICKELSIEDPVPVDDESTEPHGFWASIGYAIWHRIEFVTEKIWGKKKVDTPANIIEEKKDEDPGEDFDANNSSYFTYIKDKVFSIINLSWLFSSHGGDDNIKNGHSTPPNPELGGESPDSQDGGE